MTPPTKKAFDGESVEGLLALRQKKPRQADCPGMVWVSSVMTGGADAEQIQAAGKHLETCEDCRQLVGLYGTMEESYRQTNRGLNSTPSPSKSPIHFLRRFAWVVACSSFLVAGAVAALWLSSKPTGQPQVDFVLKGQVDNLAVAVQRGKSRFSVQPGDRLVAGDQLGFFYSAASPGYLALLDLEESGQSTLLYPIGESTSASIAAGHQLPLPDNGIVREVEGCEWLVAVFSHDPLPVSRLRQRLRSAAKAPKTECQLDISLPQARTVWVFPLR